MSKWEWIFIGLLVNFLTDGMVKTIMTIHLSSPIGIVMAVMLDTVFGGISYYLGKREVAFLFACRSLIHLVMLVFLVFGVEFSAISLFSAAALALISILVSKGLSKLGQDNKLSQTRKAKEANPAQPLRLTLVNSLLSTAWLCGLVSAGATVMAVVSALLFGIANMITVIIGSTGFAAIVAANIYFMIGHVLIRYPYEVQYKRWLRFRAIESPKTEIAEKPKRNLQQLVGDDGELVQLPEDKVPKKGQGSLSSTQFSRQLN